MQIQLSRTQAGPGRAVKEQQEQNSPDHVQRTNLISVYNINPKSRLASPTHPAPSDCVLGRAVKVEGEGVGLAEITTFIFAASSINFLNFFYIIIPEAVVTLTVRRYAVCTHRVTVTGGHQDILSVITYLLAGENWSFASCVVFHKTSKPL